MVKRSTRSWLAAASIAVLVTIEPAAAHTDSDYVAVPTGAQATVKLKPTHGCGESPTVRVSIRAPLPGAVAGAVGGWTATAGTTEADGEGRTVLEWAGGSLPSHETGEFPVTFTAAGEPGDLLIFPAVQVCANGEELAWIEGDPGGEFPAPRLLLLAAGSEPAETIEDVPLDAPGRDQLVAIIDVDDPSSDTTTTTAATRSDEATAPPVEDADDDSASALVALGIAALAVLAGGGVLMARRRKAA